MRQRRGVGDQRAAGGLDDVHVQLVGAEPVHRLGEHGPEQGGASTARTADGQPVPPSARSTSSSSRDWRSGRSTRPIASWDRRRGSPGAAGSRRASRSPAPTSSGSGGCQGRWGRGRPSATACAVTARQSRVRSLSRPVGSSPSDGSGRVGQTCTRTSGPCAAAVPGAPATRATWKATGLPLPERRKARPGRSTGRWAASTVPRTSRESASSVVRRQIRRVQLARISGDTTPLGRWVASTRWTPRDRPRCAIATRPGTKAGSSSASVANSSTTMTRRARATSSGSAAIVHGVVRGEDLFPPAQLGAPASAGPGPSSGCPGRSPRRRCAGAQPPRRTPLHPCSRRGGRSSAPAGDGVPVRRSASATVPTSPIRWCRLRGRAAPPGRGPPAPAHRACGPAWPRAGRAPASRTLAAGPRRA